MEQVMEKVVSLCKRKGFIFQSSEIYGGLNGCWDYGPLGAELLRNIKESWWRAMTWREDVEGIDASILMHPRVWEASGHVDGFHDPLVEDRKTHERFRLDHVLEENGVDPTGWSFEEMAAKLSELAIRSPRGNELSEPRHFNLMFKTHVGPVEDDASVTYLRPETAQGIFVNFLNVQTAMRQKLPFGIAQIGKSFRNEINTKNFLFRVREFEQMEMQYFVEPGSEDEWFDYWKEQRWNWFADLGIPGRSCAGMNTSAPSSPITRARPSTSSTNSLSGGVKSKGSTTAASSISAGTRSSRERRCATSTRNPARSSCLPWWKPRSAPPVRR